MTAAAFCTITASTKRNVDLGSGRTGAAITNLASLLITPLWPLSNETIRQLEINSPREMKECYHVPASGVTLPDVVEGDILVIAGDEYKVQFSGEWTDSGIPTLQIVVDEVKGT